MQAEGRARTPALRQAKASVRGTTTAPTRASALSQSKSERSGTAQDGRKAHERHQRTDNPCTCGHVQVKTHRQPLDRHTAIQTDLRSPTNQAKLPNEAHGQAQPGTDADPTRTSPRTATTSSNTKQAAPCPRQQHTITTSTPARAGCASQREQEQGSASRRNRDHNVTWRALSAKNFTRAR